MKKIDERTRHQKCKEFYKKFDLKKLFLFEEKEEHQRKLKNKSICQTVSLHLKDNDSLWSECPS